MIIYSVMLCARMADLTDESKDTYDVNLLFFQ